MKTKIVAIALAATAATALVAQNAVPNKPEEIQPLKLGAKVPAKTKVMALNGKEMSLGQILGKKPAVLIFYRGGWCPFCNKHLAELGAIQEELEKTGVPILAFSPDSTSELQKTMEKDAVKYQLFSDSKADLMRAFGVAFRLDDETFTYYKERYSIDLERSSGQNHHLLPVPSVFVVDSKGVIQFAHSNPDYRVRMSATEVLEAAKSVMKQSR